LFECEAELSDKSVPWQYTSVSFQVVRGDFKAEFDIEEASRSGQLRLYSGTDEISKFYLENINGVQIKRKGNFECLVSEFDKENFVLPLELQTKPVIKLIWGTSLDLRK
ncbi:hypothetical protein, partial [Paenibacillus germinis]|uniref:hypothetical protein n=1 Tax=Paenibacillus germinis TaxID=2654979 RepID=UPI001493038E